MREELEQLNKRPGTDPESRQIEQRILELQQNLQDAEVVPPPANPGPADRIRFGATVTVRQRGVETNYRIVGVSEVDLDRGWVSWLSPIARALLNTQPGQRVKFKFPSGEEELEILRVIYE